MLSNFMEKITITLDRTIWKELMKMKIKFDSLRTFDDIILHLLENQKEVKGK